MYFDTYLWNDLVYHKASIVYDSFELNMFAFALRNMRVSNIHSICVLQNQLVLMYHKEMFKDLNYRLDT